MMMVTWSSTGRTLALLFIMMLHSKVIITTTSLSRLQQDDVERRQEGTAIQFVIRTIPTEEFEDRSYEKVMKTKSHRYVLLIIHLK